MPVNTPHTDYMTHANLWRKCRDAAAGQEAIHAAGKSYLPALAGQASTDYEAYKSRALYYNATARTIDGLSGMMFRKKPMIKASTALQSVLQDITLNGIDVYGFADQVVEEVLTVGRAGILVDYPVVDQETQQPLTQADAAAQGVRPFWRIYKAEDILNWRMGDIDNVLTLTQVVLTETISQPSQDDPFINNVILQYRTLTIEEGIYVQKLYRQDADAKDGFALVQKIVPTQNGQPLTRIPFVFVGLRDTSCETDKPPLLDLVNVNLSHYRTTADYEHGAHFTGLPTAVVSGHRLDANEEALAIGSGEAWVLSEADAKAYYLEFSGQGLNALSDLLDRKEQQMATLGARMLSADKRMTEAAETAQIHRQGEQSVLASLSRSVSSALTKAMEITRDWMGIGTEVKITLNTDFFPSPMSPQKLRELVTAWQSGALTDDDLQRNLIEGELIEQ